MSSNRSEPWLVPLNETVIIGYSDIAAAGSRALLGLSDLREQLVFEIPQLPNAKPCCVLDPKAAAASNKGKKTQEKPLGPFIVYNCKNHARYSLVVLNCHIPAACSHSVVKYLVEACRTSFARRVFLLSGQHFDLPEGPLRPLYDNCWNGMGPGTACPVLSRDVKLYDAFLSNFIQMFMIDGTPFSTLIALCNKAEAGHASEIDGSLDVIEMYQEHLSEITGLRFSLATSKSLVYDGNPGENADMVAMIYV